MAEIYIKSIIFLKNFSFFDTAFSYRQFHIVKNVQLFFVICELFYENVRRNLSAFGDVEKSLKTDENGDKTTFL